MQFKYNITISVCNSFKTFEIIRATFSNYGDRFRQTTFLINVDITGNNLIVVCNKQLIIINRTYNFSVGMKLSLPKEDASQAQSERTIRVLSIMNRCVSNANFGKSNM